MVFFLGCGRQLPRSLFFLRAAWEPAATSIKTIGSAIEVSRKEGREDKGIEEKGKRRKAKGERLEARGTRLEDKDQREIKKQA
jgi:hypothetical protein